MKRKLMIVIEENGKDDGKGFDVYLDGDVERIDKIDFDQMSPAEFWGIKLFRICGQILQQTMAKAGVTVTQTVKDPEVSH